LPRPVVAAIQWVPPSDPRIKWNVDGSSLGKPGEASIGGVLRNSNRDFLCIFSYHIGLEVSNMAKINAIAKALEILVSKGLLMIQPCVESDSNNTLAWVAATAEVPWRMRMVANKTHVLSKFFSWVAFRHTPWAAYSIADG